jgi:hypothetical protein
MKIPNSNITTTDEYISFVEKFVTLVDQELSKYEEMVLVEKGAVTIVDQGESKPELFYVIHSIHDVASHMPALISLVNTVGYLRGQDGVFVDFRPSVGRKQNDLYELENLFEKRLEALIDKILGSKEKSYYLQRLDSYFTKTRSKQPPTL